MAAGQSLLKMLAEAHLCLIKTHNAHLCFILHLYWAGLIYREKEKESLISRDKLSDQGRLAQALRRYDSLRPLSFIHKVWVEPWVHPC